MVEVFFCTAPATEERREIARQMLAKWRSYLLTIIVFTPEILGVSNLEFQKARRVYADCTARGKQYILTDDDCELKDFRDIPKGLKTLKENPEFGILSAWPDNCCIHRWTPEYYLPTENLDVMEHHSVGGIRFIQKGRMTHGWMEQTGPGYDKEHCEGMRLAGFRVGYLQHVRMLHLGEHKSTVWELV